MTTKSSQLAFTVLELIISSTILVLMIGAMMHATNSGMAQFRSASAEGDIGIHTTRALHRLVQELYPARLASLTPDLEPPAIGVHSGSPEVSFQSPEAWVADSVVWGPKTKVAFELEVGETDDGTDENGNGLIDEGVLTITWDEGGVNQKRVVLAHDVSEFLEGETENGLDDNGNGLVDERGLSLDVLDGVLTVRLTLATLGPRGELMEHTEERLILLRNL